MEYMKLRKLIAIMVGVLCLCPAAYGQSLEQAVKAVDVDIREAATKRLERPPTKKPEIKIEEKKLPKGPSFFIKKISLVGAESFLPEDFKGLVEKYENRKVTMEEMGELGKEIEREYLKSGIICACFVPPQEIKDETVTLQIVEAKMGILNINDNRFFNKRSTAMYWTIKPGETIRYDKISRSLYLINKNPDREAKATLHAGKTPKTTDVTLDVASRMPFHGTFYFDNEGAKSTGKNRYTVGSRYNNFLGMGDSLLGGYMFGKDFHSLFLYHSVPLSPSGLSVMYGYSRSKAFPKGDLGRYGISALSENTSFIFHQDLFDKGKYLGEAYCGIDTNDKTVRRDLGTLTRDKLTILRMGSNIMNNAAGGLTYIHPEFSQGLNFLGARRKNSYSSRGSTNTFSKATLGIRHTRPMPFNTQATLSFKGQWCFEKLPPQEEMFLGGINSVRGYPAGDFTADKAFQTTMEILIPPFIIPKTIKIPYDTVPLRNRLTGIAFFDYGYGQKIGLMGSEDDNMKLASVGGGLRLRFFDQALLRVEIGWPIGLGDRPKTEYNSRLGSRVHFSVDFEDHILDELQKIVQLKEGCMREKYAWDLLNNELTDQESPLREELYSYLYLAEAAYEKDELEKARDYYLKILTTCDSLYKQSLEYVEEAVAFEKRLEEKSVLASKFYREGELKKAKEIWQDILKQAKIKPLMLEF
jgi:hemolysin activation/secretion protein